MLLTVVNSDARCELSEAVFAVPPSEALIHQTLTSYLSSLRGNTSKQKTRGEVKGHARKPWKQKGTGRARHGSSKSPLWRGGGVTFASNKPNWQQKINRKAWRATLRMLLSELVRADRLLVVESAYDGEPKTKKFLEWRKDLKLNQSTLLVVDKVEPTSNLKLASRNLKDFTVCGCDEINPYLLMNFDAVVVTVEVADILNQKLAS